MNRLKIEGIKTHKKTLRIAMVTPVYTAESSWGPVTVIKSIMKGLKDRGYNFVVYAGNAESPNKLANLPTREHIDGILVKRYETMINIGSYQITPLMFMDLLGDDFDLIHAHVTRSFQLDLAAFVAMLRSKPLIISAHGTLANYLFARDISERLRCLHKVHNTVLGFTLNQAKIATALSVLEARQYKQLFKVPPNRIAIVPNGIDSSVYSKLPLKGVFRKKYNIENDKKIILYVGRINKIKGIDFLIRSLSYLVKKKNCDEAVLVIAGPDDGFLHEAELLSHSLGVGDKVVFTGFLTEHDKVCAYVDSTVVVHPESFNVILIAPLEAIASGKPIVLSSGNYLSEIAEREGFGFSVQYDNVVAMAEVLRKVLREGDLAEVMGNKGREFVLRNLSWHIILEEYEKIYRRAARS
jgi:glycosyltransferase involved in cell wall biosynthesis